MITKCRNEKEPVIFGGGGPLLSDFSDADSVLSTVGLPTSLDLPTERYDGVPLIFSLILYLYFFHSSFFFKSSLTGLVSFSVEKRQSNSSLLVSFGPLSSSHMISIDLDKIHRMLHQFIQRYL